MTTDNTQPSAADVSGFYDVGTQVLMTIWSESFHVGYWHDDDDDTPNQQAVERMEDELFGRLGVSADSRVLDVGCGIGTPAFRLARTTGAQVLGITIDPGEVELSNRRAAEQGLTGQVEFEHADALALPYPDDSFDAAVAIESLIHMDRVPALREIARVVRPGGAIVISDLLQREELAAAEQAELAKILEAMALTPINTLDSYRDLVSASGLTLLELADITPHTHRTGSAMAESAKENYDDLVGRFGDEAVGVLEHMMNPMMETGMLLAVVRS